MRQGRADQRDIQMKEEMKESNEEIFFDLAYGRTTSLNVPDAKHVCGQSRESLKPNTSQLHHAIDFAL